MSEVRRIVLSADSETYAKLESMANGPRFGGNRSRAMSWAIALAAEVMSHPLVNRRLFETPHELLDVYVEAVVTPESLEALPKTQAGRKAR